MPSFKTAFIEYLKTKGLTYDEWRKNGALLSKNK